MRLNIKTKALAIVTCLILFLSGLYLFYGVQLHNEQIEATIAAEERTIDATVGDIQRYSYAPYRARLGNMIEEHPDLVRAFAERDRKRLYELSLPIFTRRREENPFLHAWDFNLPDGTVFLRVQDPDAHGDDISQTRRMLQAVHDRKEPAAGFDVGRHGAIYWTARPVFFQGRYVGATELGLPAEQLAEALKSRFKSQVAVTVKAAEWQKATMVGSGYRQQGDNVLIAPEDSLYMMIPIEAVFSGTERRIRLGAGDYVLHNCAVLLDYRGRTVGKVLVLQDITERLAHRREFILGGVTASGLLLGVCFAVLYASFGTLIGRLEKSSAETRRAKEEIERSRDELDRRVRERTEELQSANRSLDEQRGFLKTILESLTHPFYVIDASSYRILLANKAANPGRDGGEPVTCFAMTHGRAEPCTGVEHPCALQEVKRTKRPAVLEHIHRVEGGGIVLSRFSPIPSSMAAARSSRSSSTASTSLPPRRRTK